jgi:hypothetical protein
MKKITILAILLASFTAKAQLSENSKYIKEQLPEYYNQIKCICEKDWKGDNVMMVYSINQQSDSFFEYIELINMFKAEEVVKLLWDWYDKECDSYDFTMSVYTLKQQIKNKDY